MRPSARRVQAFLGLQRRLQAVRPVAVLHDAAGELVHDLDAPVADEVVDVAAQQGACVQRAVELGEEPVVLLRHQAPAAQGPLHVFVARFRELDVAAVLVGVEVHAGREGRRHLRHLDRRRGRRRGVAGDDEGHARLVHEQRIRLVDEREVERTMDEVGRVPREEVAQVVEARFLGRHVGHVGPIRAPPLGGAAGGRRPSPRRGPARGRSGPSIPRRAARGSR